MHLWRQIDCTSVQCLPLWCDRNCTIFLVLFKFSPVQHVFLFDFSLPPSLISFMLCLSLLLFSYCHMSLYDIFEKFLWFICALWFQILNIIRVCKISQIFRNFSYCQTKVVLCSSTISSPMETSICNEQAPNHTGN